MNLVKVIIAIVLFLDISFCSKTRDSQSIRDGERNLRSTLKGLMIDKDYVFCDSSEKGETSCYLEFRNKRYLKKEQLFFGSNGQIEKVYMFKPEGVLEYSSDQLKQDSLLNTTLSWNYGSNKILINNDSITHPIRLLVSQVEKGGKVVYSTKHEGDTEWLYVFELF